MNKYIFEYKRSGLSPVNEAGKTTNLFFWIIIVSIDIAFISFLILFFTVSNDYLPFVILFGIFSVFFVPYAIITRNQYYFALTDNNMLIMKSAVNFILRSHVINLSEIARICMENPVNSQALLFENAEGEVIAKFDHRMMSINRLKEYMELIKQRGPHIQIDITEITLPNDDRL